MGLVSGILVYVVSWWLVFFMSLPIGVQAQDEDGGEVTPGTPESAPKKPMLLKKALFASIGALIIWATLYWAIDNQMLNIRGN